MSEPLSQQFVPPDSVPAEATGRPRWHRLVPGIAAAVWRRIGWAVAIGYFVVALALLALRYSVLPNIDSYRGELEGLFSDALGLRVSIAAVDAHWHGLRPHLGLSALKVFDRNGRPALSFDRVDTEFSWSSLLFWDLRLHRLDIANPTLEMRRERDGKLYVGGIDLSQPGEGGGFSRWLLKQHRIAVRDATLHWDDAQRGAPRLTLSRVNLRLESQGSRHRFGFTADPPPELATRLDVRGDLHGRDPDRLDQWRGEAYAALDHVDLSGWRGWFDYPLELPQGSGAVRLWLAFAGRHIDSLSADVALADVQVRLERDLPMLELKRLNGRLGAKLPASGFELSSRRLVLESRDGARLAPTDALLRWTPAAGRVRGDLTANQLDLETLARLAAYLPLDAQLKRHWVESAPRGRLADVKIHWSGAAGRPSDYAFRARLEAVGLKARGVVPGFEGISGTVEGSEKGGTATLIGRDGALDLPAAFPESRIPLRELNAQASWHVLGDEVAVQIENVSFANQDATGSAAGSYRYVPGGPGHIDLTARLSRGEGSAVWRYLPLKVNSRVREWLRRSLAGGRSDDTRLRLKGDLRHFPFVDAKLGTFQVSGRFAGASLRYAEEWPEISKIDGNLLFEGKRMLIQANKASIFGVGLTEVQAEIPDLLATTDEVLNLKGRGGGPTQDFLRFIEASPVGEHINHFTKEMRAEGTGTLRLNAVMNLRRLDKTRVEGEFQFANNRVYADPALPPLTGASGRLQFTESSVTMRGVNASFLGAPVVVNADTKSDGEFAIDAQGSATAADIRQALDWPLLDHLSGTTGWRALLTVRKNAVAMSVDSDLRGIASSLPEPFNKTAAESSPLHFERLLALQQSNGDGPTPHGLIPGQDLLRATLGKAFNLALVRRREGAKYVVERGHVGVPEAPPMPERGVALAAALGSVDGDAWRRLLAGPGDAGAAPPPVDSIKLRAAEMTVFGQKLKDLDLNANLREGLWQAQVASRELNGTLSWRSQGRGRLVARLRELALAEVQAEPPRSTDEDAELRELPGLDVSAEAFKLRGKLLGSLELVAVNQAELWRIERLALMTPDGSLDGEGAWRTPGGQASTTQLSFRVHSANAGKLLERLGYADTLRRGTATLEGNVSWRGVPTSIDYASLDGSFSLDAKAGQFNKVDPGVGRLLGVLSLQALPRRITLDFRDIFSEGFAFDSISGSMTVKRGVMETKELSIRGPAAKVRMAGQVSLTEETQDLRVRVQPTLSETVAIGAAIANPVAGVAAFVAQKVLRDPIEQMFAFEYAVTGGWADPKVEKVQPPPQRVQ